MLKRCKHFSRFLERHWYQNSLTVLTVLLLPLSLLFRVIVSLRRFLYKSNIKTSYHFSVPIIVVGNITVGGTGKTPCVIYLAKKLRALGYSPGIVSRGVGGRKHLSPYWVQADANVYEVGDEAILLAKKSAVPVVICIDRVAAVKELLGKTSCNIVICDDGLQHYRLQRSFEIVLVDNLHGFGNQQLLPAGPLREPMARLKEVDFVLNIDLQGNNVISVLDETHSIPMGQFQEKKVHAVAGIGNPERFFSFLRSKGFTLITHVFPDHYFYQKEDLHFSDDLPIIMTEKDAVKCRTFDNPKLWYIPVEMMPNLALESAIQSRL